MKKYFCLTTRRKNHQRYQSHYLLPLGTHLSPLTIHHSLLTIDIPNNLLILDLPISLIMKKYLLPCLFLLFPLALAAQEEAMSIYKDFYNKVKSVVSFVWDDHTNIVTLDIDNENFDVVAVNDQMQMAWRSSLAGFVLKTARFKDKIIAIAATEHSTFEEPGIPISPTLLTRQPANNWRKKRSTTATRIM